MSLILHGHPLASYCWKTLIALNELGLGHEVRQVDLGDAQARAAFEALWPTAKIPLLQDGEKVIAETSIQIEYLHQREGSTSTLLPVDAEACLRVRLWDRLFDSYVMTPMQNHIAQLLRPEAQRDHGAIEAANAALASAYEWIEARMDHSGNWAVGDGFSMADCAAAPSLFYAVTIVPFAQRHTHLRAYFERLMARPSVHRVIRDAGPWFRYYPQFDAIDPCFLASDDAHRP